MPGQCARQQHVGCQMRPVPSRGSWRVYPDRTRPTRDAVNGHGADRLKYGQSFTGLTERRRSGKLPGRAVTLDDGGLGGVLSGAEQSTSCWQFGPGGAISGVRGRPYRSRIHDEFQRRSPSL